MHILSEELAAFLRVEHCCVSHVLELDQQHLCWAPGALVSRVGRKSFVCLLFCTDGFCSTCPSCDWLLVLNLLCFRLFRSVTLSPDR